MANEYTKNWVMFEVGLARQAAKKVFVYERQGVTIPYPIPYLTDYMIFDPQSIDDLLAVQTIAKELLGRIPAGWAGAGLGAIVGVVFGPLGVAIGAITGGLFGHGIDVQSEANIPLIECPYDSCHVKFRYYSPNTSSFLCPACRRAIALVSDK